MQVYRALVERQTGHLVARTGAPDFQFVLVVVKSARNIVQGIWKKYRLDGAAVDFQVDVCVLGIVGAMIDFGLEAQPAPRAEGIPAAGQLHGLQGLAQLLIHRHVAAHDVEDQTR